MSKKSHCRIAAVVNQKGGVGKTTTSVNLGAYLAAAGSRVLLVDCDPQSNATSGVAVEKGSISEGLYDVLAEGQHIENIVIENVAGIKGFDLAPSTLDLSGVEVKLYSQQNFNRETVLKKALKSVRDDYDYILIDAPPSLGLLTVNVLTAAEGLIIPIQCEYYALEGISQLLNVIERIRENLNPSVAVDMVVLTMHDYRTNLSAQVIDDVRGYFGDLAAKSIIPRNVRLSEAPGFGQPIGIYDAASKGAQAYEELAKEYAARIKVIRERQEAAN
jgi:chromosome partitioning protein